MKWTLNIPELLHYIIGGLILINLWIPTMNFFQGNLLYTGIAWIFEYIVVDQILHVIVKHEDIAIIQYK